VRFRPSCGRLLQIRAGFGRSRTDLQSYQPAKTKSMLPTCELSSPTRLPFPPLSLHPTSLGAVRAVHCAAAAAATAFSLSLSLALQSSPALPLLTHSHLSLYLPRSLPHSLSSLRAQVVPVLYALSIMLLVTSVYAVVASQIFANSSPDHFGRFTLALFSVRIMSVIYCICCGATIAVVTRSLA
jgi:hypothetical protein